MARRTIDGEFLAIMLSDKPKATKARELAALKKVAAEQRGEAECPDCGDAGPHDDNGAARRSELSWCCRACGTHFDAEPA